MRKDRGDSLAARVRRHPAEAEPFSSLTLYGSSAQIHEESTIPGGDGTGRHLFLQNESGSGEITLYQVFPGIELVYNDIHMGCCNAEQVPAANVAEINFCREGRCECQFGEQEFCYMAAGDLAFCSLQEKAHRSFFPTAHYHGITVTIDLAGITGTLQGMLEELSVDMDRLLMLTRLRGCTILRARPRIVQIFSELYDVPERLRCGYLRVKVLELLLVLTDLPEQELCMEREHYAAAQVEKIKTVHDFLVGSYREHHTIEELAERFRISPTTLKRCFRGIYGASVYAYMKRYRLQRAEQLLQETELTIGEIAAGIGYENPNKFTAAFGKEYGMSPGAFRRREQMHPEEGTGRREWRPEKSRDTRESRRVEGKLETGPNG